MKAMVVIPTYNEKENIKEIISEILKLEMGFEVLVVDDNSPDGTGDIVDAMRKDYSRLHVIHRTKKLGLSSAYKEGFNYALKNGADFVFSMDADFSHDPKCLPQFMEKIKEADVVIGSRYLNGISVVNWSLKRLILSLSGSLYARIITGLKLKDCTSGFKCFRRHVLESINFNSIHSDGYAFQIEINYYCKIKGFVVKETPIIFVDRRVGKSKISKKIIIEAFFVVWKLRLETIIQSLKGLVDKKRSTEHPHIS